MHEANDFLRNLALVLCVAAVATVVFQRLRQPVVFGYLLAGLIIGPHIPVPLVADESTVSALAELGVILLMFSLGLEFTLRKLIAVAPTSGIIALAQASTMMFLGFGIGQMFGWTRLESFYAGAIIAIASTTIIVKTFAEHGVRGKLAEIVFGVLIIEDLIAIFLLVVLTAVSSPGGISAGAIGMTALRLAAFLAGLLGVGLLIVPRLMRAVVSLGRKETTLVASIGICFASALLALKFGYSVALGAFLAGSLIAESGAEKVVEHLVHPVRDMFAAVFFVSVGMMIDPARIAEHWGAVLVFSAVVIVGNLIVVSVSAFLVGVDARTSVQAGMSLGQIGEFSFIIAGLGLATGATGNFVYPVAIAVSALTTLTTPIMIRRAPAVAAFVDARLPRPLQTFAALYGSWIERFAAAPRVRGARSPQRRLVQFLIVDMIAIVAIVAVVSTQFGVITNALTSVTGASGNVVRWLTVALGLLAASPLVFGLVTTARRLSMLVATQALPAVLPGKVDPAAAPRGALVNAVQLAIVLLCGIVLVVVTQPFLPPLRGLVVLAVFVVLLGAAFWRSATNLHGHARAGAEIVAAALSTHLMPRDPAAGARAPVELDTVLPGLGHPVPLRIGEDSAVIGRTLAAVNLRGKTGATVLAIMREGEQILVPSGSQVLRAGDVLAVAGTHDAIASAETELGATR